MTAAIMIASGIKRCTILSKDALLTACQPQSALRLIFWVYRYQQQSNPAAHSKGMNQIAERNNIKAKGETKEKSANSHHNRTVIRIQKMIRLLYIPNYYYMLGDKICEVLKFQSCPHKAFIVSLCF